MRRRLVASVVIVVAGAIGLVPSEARAADPTTADCLAAYARSNALRRDHRLRAARPELLLCSAASCPTAVREECIRGEEETSKQRATILFAAKDPSGHDLSAVKVTTEYGEVLAERLEGTELSVDPGEHTFVFETQGQPTLRKRLVIKEGESERLEVAFLPWCSAGELGLRPSAEAGAEGQASRRGQASAPTEAFVIESIQAYFGTEDFHLTVRSAERSVEYVEDVLDQTDLRHHGIRRRFRTTLSPDFVSRIGALLPGLLAPTAPCVPVSPMPDSTSRWITVEQAGVKRTLGEPETHEPSPELFGLLHQAEVQARQHLVQTTVPPLGTRKVLAIVAGSVGVVGLGVGTAFGILAVSKKNEAESACPGGHCATQDDASKWGDARGAAYSATVGATIALITGSAELAIAAVLWLTAPPPPSGPGTFVRLGVGPGTLGLAGTW